MGIKHQIICFDQLFLVGYIPHMEWEVEYTYEFEEWWNCLSEAEQVDIDTVVRLLAAKGPRLPYPYGSSIYESKHGHMRELRIQHLGDPYKNLYAFDPRRVAILLIGGNKSGNDRWYEQYIPIADKLYDEHLRSLNQGEIYG